MRRVPLYLVAVLLLSGAVSAVVSSRQQAVDEATQRVYDRAYDVLFPGTTEGPTLRELLQAELQKGAPPAGSEFKIFKAGMPASFESPKDARLPKEARTRRFLAGELEKADLVLRGTLESSESKITRDERWVFTINRVRVSEVMARKGGHAIGDTVTVIRGGGVVQVDGYRVRALDYDYPALNAAGGDVVLFLNEVPNSEAFHTSSPDGSFVVRDGKVRQLTKHPHAALAELTTDEFRRVLETEALRPREEK